MFNNKPQQPNPYANLLNKLLEENPQVQNNPNAQAWINVLQSGDVNAMRELAMNICSSYGASPEQMANDARKFFRI